MLNSTNKSWICMICGNIAHQSDMTSPDPSGCRLKYDGQHTWVEIVGIK